MTNEKEYSDIYKALDDAKRRVDEGFPATDVLVILVHKCPQHDFFQLCTSAHKMMRRRFNFFAQELLRAQYPELVQPFVLNPLHRNN